MPVAGPVPPPIIVVTPDINASSICCGQMKWMCVSMPPAVTIMPSPAMISVPAPIDDGHARLDVRIAGLADAAMRPSLMPMSALTMPQWSTISALVMTVSATSGVRALALPHAVANHLAAAELHFLAVDGEVLLDFDRQLGVGQAHAVAGGRAEHFGVGAGGRLCSFRACP